MHLQKERKHYITASRRSQYRQEEAQALMVNVRVPLAPAPTPADACRSSSFVLCPLFIEVNPQNCANLQHRKSPKNDQNLVTFFSRDFEINVW